MKNLLLCLCLAVICNVSAQSLSVKFTNIRNNNGVFRVGFFINETSYKEGNPKYYKTVSKQQVVNGEMIYTFNDIQPGVYGIVVLDDENANDKTDYFLFFPKEGLGLSNYPITKIQIPKFKDFEFSFQNTDVLVTIQLKYL